jgi:hypothetical protein
MTSHKIVIKISINHTISKRCSDQARHSVNIRINYKFTLTRSSRFEILRVMRWEYLHKIRFDAVIEDDILA